MDDITFCMSDCQRTDCLRHPSNIQDRTIPHSYADFKGTETCPEKTQLSKEDATKDATFDCIDRQAAIDHINKKREEHLESADLISRQAAILALAEQIMESALMDNPTTASTDIDRYRPIAELSLRDVPSAQPERKQGKWIERNPQNSDKCRLIECDQCGFSHIVGFNVPYEHWIENRNFCERCGADMRGEQDG